MTYQEELQQEATVEAILFTMGRSVALHQLAVALDCEENVAREAVERLQKRYEDEHRGMEIIALEDAYQMCSRREYYDALIKVAKTPRKQVLTESVLETLSIVAYKQPVTRVEIDNIRGVSGEYALNKLIEYGLVYEAGRLDAPGRPALFATTEEFLRRFGVGSPGNLPELDTDKEAEIVEEVEKEVGYKFGVETETEGTAVNGEQMEMDFLNEREIPEKDSAAGETDFFAGEDTAGIDTAETDTAETDTAGTDTAGTDTAETVTAESDDFAESEEEDPDADED